MKGIYLTQEGKQEIEAKIADIESFGIITELHPKYSIWKTYKEILSSATILPVEESWKIIGENTGTFYDDDGEVLHSHFKNGVIIQPKQ